MYKEKIKRKYKKNLVPKENKKYNKIKEMKTPTRLKLVSNHHTIKKRERSKITRRWQKASL
jgi:hypothetical protein